jgi:urate oxidase
VESFSSGWKRNYYGKGDVTVYRLRRDGATSAGQSAVFGANVKMLLHGDSFWPTYTTGDNTGLIATDSMKNFIQRETMNYSGSDLETYCKFLAEKFIGLYPQVEGIQVSATEIPYGGQGKWAFSPSGPEQATARVEINRGGIVEAVSGIRGFRLLRLGGSAFKGFVRDEYTTLPDIENRPLHMWLDLEWKYTEVLGAFNGGEVARAVGRMTHELFDAFESGSIQEVIYQLGTRMLTELPTIEEIHLEANNRTWDTIAEQGSELGVYTDARPPYGCLGLRMRR